VDQFEFFEFKRLGRLTQSYQISIIVFLYLVHLALAYIQFRQTGKVAGYSPSATLLFVPIYEEWIFRGIFLKFFEKHYGKFIAVGVTSILFGLWHLKNAFWISPDQLYGQIAYTALIFSPIVSMITLKCRSLWPAVMLHYVNNLPFETLWSLFN
jgi:membrane protease YdiL (CAAX protease family)